MEAVEVYKLVGVVLYLAALLAIGVVASRRMSDVSDYYAGGKQLGFWSVAFSARATGESGWLLLGLSGMGAMVGVQAFWVVAGEVLGVGLAWLLMARRFNRLTRRMESITVPDFLESRFGGMRSLRLVSAICLAVFVTIYVAAQIYATGQAFSDFLGWNWYAGVFVGFAVVVAYSMSGGFVAVVWSDVFQGVLMFLGLVLLPIVGVVYAGGVGTVVDGLRAIDPALLSVVSDEGWTLIGVAGSAGLLLIGLGFLGSPQIFVRFLALRDESEVPKGMLVAVVWTLLADSGAVLTGMVGRYLLTQPGQDPEAVLGTGAESVLPQLVEVALPALLVGLFIAIVLSAIMSTVDSLLVLASSAVVRDVYQKVLRPDTPDAALVRLSRIATLVVAGVALAIALVATGPNQTVFWFVIFGWSGIAATFCPTLILSLFWRRFTGAGAIAAMVTGFVAVPLIKFGGPHLGQAGPVLEALGELPPSFALSAMAGLLVSLVTTPPADVELSR